MFFKWKEKKESDNFSSPSPANDETKHLEGLLSFTVDLSTLCMPFKWSTPLVKLQNNKTLNLPFCHLFSQTSVEKTNSQQNLKEKPTNW